MLQLILKVLFIVFAFQALRALVRRARSGGSSGSSRVSGKEKDRVPDYSELTPYDIEDADYEELPREKE